MDANYTEVKNKGKTFRVPHADVEGRDVVVTGKWLRVAAVNDEIWLEGEPVDDPETFIRKLRESPLKADVFTFMQKLPSTAPRYGYHYEWDNVAAIAVTTYKEWEAGLSQDTRRNVRRGPKKGVVARVAEFDDELVRGIIGIHDEAPMRQGLPFAHYGKGFDTVKADYGTFPEQSEFLGAYLGDELIGVIKLVHMGNAAGIMQIVTKTLHYDKRPTNLLIAKAVEVCAEKKIPYLTYCKYVYGNKTDNTLTEFKRRNGFVKVDLPRYYVPLTLRGKVAMKLRLHRGALGILPLGAITLLLGLRSRYNRLRHRLSGRDPEPPGCMKDDGSFDTK